MPEVPPPVVLQPFRFFFLPFLPFLHFFGFFLATTAGPPADSAGTASTAPARAAARTAIVILLTTRFTPDHSAVAPDDRSESPPARRTSVVTFRVIERHIFRVKNRRARADKKLHDLRTDELPRAAGGASARALQRAGARARVGGALRGGPRSSPAPTRAGGGRQLLA